LYQPVRKRRLSAKKNAVRASAVQRAPRAPPLQPEIALGPPIFRSYSSGGVFLARLRVVPEVQMARGRHYLPMQKVEKMRLRMSSAVVTPVMASSGCSAQ
jgi:hypothetical protein